MKKWEPMNMELRSWVIENVLRLEQTTTEALITIFRIFKRNPKTLGNQSSALSFKSKIDLLYDLEEIDKIKYGHLIKLMEIRNQFAHNPEAISFEVLDKFNPEINKYLKKYCPKALENESNRETRLKGAFNQLFEKTAGHLIAITYDYKAGMEIEMRKYINDKAIEDIELIWQKALERNKETKSEIPSMFFLKQDDDPIKMFKNYFMISLYQYVTDELDKLKGKENEVFRQKVTINGRYEKRKIEKMNDKTNQPNKED